MKVDREAVPLRKSAFEGLVADLERLVVDDSEPGSEIPSEGELALRFGVSRLTVREALKVLAGRDLVELRNGRRAVVRALDSSTLAKYLSIVIRRDPSACLELYEIRMALEVQSASLAAEKSTRASRAAVKSALDRMTVAVAEFAHRDSSDEYNEADIDFHGALALASGNQMLALLLTSLEDSLRASFQESFDGHVARGRSLEEALQRHVQVYQRVVDRDRRGASAAMRATLRESKRDLLASFSRSFAGQRRTPPDQE